MDTAVKSLKSIKESGEYDYVPDVVLFDAHDEFDGRRYIKDASGKLIDNPNHGKLIRRFDKNRLEEVVSVCNKRGEAGDLAPIGPGHLIPNAREVDQPAIWGYAAGEYRVAEFGPKKKLGILTGFYMKKRIEIPDGMGGKKTVSGREALTEFPRRSIEIWHKDSFIDWIALLRQTPERDLGLTASPYSKDLYASWNSEISLDAHHSRYARAADDGLKLRYAMDEAPDDPTKPPSSAITPTDQPLSPEEEAQAERFMCHYMKKHPWMQDACTKYSAVMSGTNTGMPSSNVIPEKETDMADEKDVAKYQKDLEDRDAQIKALTEEVAKLKDATARQERLAKYSKELQTLADEGYQLNVAEESIDTAELTDAQFTKHLERIKKHYQKQDKAPVGGEEIPTADPIEKGKQLKEDEMPKVLKYMREKGMGFEDAVSAYRKAN